jgi:hypothetical protein
MTNGSFFLLKVAVKITTKGGEIDHRSLNGITD